MNFMKLSHFNVILPAEVTVVRNTGPLSIRHLDSDFGNHKYNGAHTHTHIHNTQAHVK